MLLSISLAVFYVLCGVYAYGRYTTFFWYNYPNIQSRKQWIETKVNAVLFSILGPVGLIPSLFSGMPNGMEVEYRWKMPPYSPPPSYAYQGFLIDPEITKKLIEKSKANDLHMSDASLVVGLVEYSSDRGDCWGVLLGKQVGDYSFFPLGNLYVRNWYSLRFI